MSECVLACELQSGPEEVMDGLPVRRVVCDLLGLKRTEVRVRSMFREGKNWWIIIAKAAIRQQEGVEEELRRRGLLEFFEEKHSRDGSTIRKPCVVWETPFAM